MVVWGVVRVIRALIDWRAKIDFEKAHAASVVAVVSSVPADGTVLRVDIPVRQELRNYGSHETAGTESC